MLSRNKSFDYKYCVQYLDGCHDHLDSDAHIRPISNQPEEEACPMLRICSWDLHSRSVGPKEIYIMLTRAKILCAILNKFYSFTQPFGSEWTFWYIRESSTALITASLPMTWTLFRHMFNLRSFMGSSKDRYGSRPITDYSGSRSQTHRSAARSVVRSVAHPEATDVDSFDSQEEINRAYGIPLRVK